MVECDCASFIDICYNTLVLNCRNVYDLVNHSRLITTILMCSNRLLTHIAYKVISSPFGYIIYFNFINII